MGCISTRLVITVAIAVATLATPAQTVNAQTLTVLHTFTGGADGGLPQSMLTMDAEGNLYGTTLMGGAGNNGYGFGTVFEMVKQNGGWNLVTLYDFQGDPGNNDGAGPIGKVIFGPHGGLYGTTVAGGGGTVGTGCADEQYNGCGSVFSLTPPGQGEGDPMEQNEERTDGGKPPIKICTDDCPWTERVLVHLVNGPGGVYPFGGVVFDAHANIYATTQLGNSSGDGLGTVLELGHADSGWQPSTIDNFTGGDGGEPYDTLAVDSAGNLYGTTRGGGANGYGEVFELSPTGSGWEENILYSFRNGDDGALPFGGVIFDSAGNLYGTTSCNGANGGGTVFELTPSGDSWQFNLLYSFNGDCQWGPQDSLAMDAAGNLYGTTFEDGANDTGSVFKLTNSNGQWTYTDLYDFPECGPKGADPYGGPVVDGEGNIYGTTTACGASPGYGTLWKLTQ